MMSGITSSSSPRAHEGQGGGSSSPEASLEQRLLQALRDAKLALDAAQLHQASELMQTADALCESAMRDPSCLSRSGLAEIQQLFATCLEAGKPLHEQIVKRMAGSGAVGKAARAYQPRRRRSSK